MHLLVCDRTACPSQRPMDDECDVSGWIVVHSPDPDDDHIKHYCSKTCLVADMAAFEVPEGVPHD